MVINCKQLKFTCIANHFIKSNSDQTRKECHYGVKNHLTEYQNYTHWQLALTLQFLFFFYMTLVSTTTKKRNKSL